MSRIIADSFIKSGPQTFGEDANSALNRKIQAVNNMYGWLYERGILSRVAFELKDTPKSVCFALDTKDLAPYRAVMEQSDSADAALAVHHIFNEDYTPCMYSGAIQLVWPMLSYRSVDGCVGKSWEIDLIKGLNTDAIYQVDKVKNEQGVKSAISKTFSFYNWPEQKQEAGKCMEKLSVDISDILSGDASFRYRMLDRMRLDCEYYLGYGNRCSKHLWACSEKDQIACMKAIWDTFPDSEKPEWLSYDQILEYEKKMVSEKAPLTEQIQAADKKAVALAADKKPIFLFQEISSGDRMGKPGDANNTYYADWFKFYSFGPDLFPRSEGTSLNFKDPTTHKAVPGGNGISEADVIESFRKAHPDRTVVVLEIEPDQGDLDVKMHQAILKYKEEGQSLLTLPPLEAPSKESNISR